MVMDPARPDRRRQRADAQLERAVLDELRRDGRVRSCDIGVEVRRGVASLFGVVATRADRRAVVAAVRRVRGVRGIDDRSLMDWR